MHASAFRKRSLSAGVVQKTGCGPERREIAWLQDHPGDAYEDQKALAWQRFYEEPPESVARWIVAALRYLVEQEKPVASSRLVPA
jgi:hypothetical protein